MLKKLYKKIIKAVLHFWVGCDSPAYYFIGGVRFYDNKLTPEVIRALKMNPNDRFLMVDCDYCGGVRRVVNSQGRAFPQ